MHSSSSRITFPKLSRQSRKIRESSKKRKAKRKARKSKRKKQKRRRSKASAVKRLWKISTTGSNYSLRSWASTSTFRI